MKTRTVIVAAFLASVLTLSGCTFARSMTAQGHAEPPATAVSATQTAHYAKVGHHVYPDCVGLPTAYTEGCVKETPNAFVLRDASGKEWSVTVGDDFTKLDHHFYLVITGDLSAPSLVIASQCVDNELSEDPCFNVGTDSVVTLESGGNEWRMVMLDAWDYDHGAYAVLVCPVEGTCPVPAT